MLYIILAVLCGSITIVAMIINSHLAKKIGVLQGTLINYIVGLVSTILLLSIVRNYVDLSVGSLSEIPFWAFLGGLLGVIVVSTSNIIIPKIPTIYTTLLIFIGQLFTGIFIDYFIVGFVSKGKIIGGLLILLGLIYNSSVDKKELIN
ncbi:DMT family transporter [Clostridium gasigenes]|uniref:DMT family transporter n=1 Tax=Clostridium gasigenes TaxID=94869 RepID=A0A1H0V9N4_9CLOT|nr:DMT family transporter [Clostridium gasigenes]MBB6714575.1 DMT family transporter [Clostridium gasigenes]MBU3105669.1 DMT family transporter [Clostridium gasigenes]MBU3136139.1 DMT family transporter [Clostridium gasigenes]NKF06787.1 DMT family transporter [Clostridium gasigenes]QSW19941.1 DMT family transporter [Clostridium gasigenes]